MAELLNDFDLRKSRDVLTLNEDAAKSQNFAAWYAELPQFLPQPQAKDVVPISSTSQAQDLVPSGSSQATTAETPGAKQVLDSAGFSIELFGASPAFQDKAIQYVEQIPLADRKLLAQDHIGCAVASTVLQVAPELKGVTPRGWPPGTTYASDEGVFMSERNLVIIAESTDKGKSPRMPAAVRHELGHAVDKALYDLSPMIQREVAVDAPHMFTSTAEFAQAYDADAANLYKNRPDEATKTQIAYLLQPNFAGAQETFAEVYAGINGGTANQDQTSEILEDFPEVKALIGNLESRNAHSQKAPVPVIA